METGPAKATRCLRENLHLLELHRKNFSGKNTFVDLHSGVRPPQSAAFELSYSGQLSVIYVGADPLTVEAFCQARRERPVQ